ncbi:MAG: hypothetical protein GY868_14075 [Deltaproteobacteria bacterium]|nr:hypothetical protein [Deltaproteobacteria bacterium]
MFILVCFGCQQDESQPSQDVIDGIAETPAPRHAVAEVYETTMPANDDPVDVYYPAEESTDNATSLFPIALLLQGAYCDKSLYSEFARTVAGYGFIVVVPNHWRAFEIYGVPMEGLLAEGQQLYDVLDFMVAENSNVASQLYGRVDTTRLVMLGHSFGSANVMMAIQDKCPPPFCPEGTSFTRPQELMAVALSGIKSPVYGWLLTRNQGLPLAIVNGELDSNATYDETLTTYQRIKDPPRAVVLVKGANHYGLCNVNNPAGPSPDEHIPTLAQEVSIETSARWSALFLRAHALDDQEAWDYIYKNGAYLDSNVEVLSDPGN